MSEIKDVLDVLDRLGIDIVRITENEIQCRCPFKDNHKHNDQKGSFYVERNTGLCYCHVGCISGSLVDLVIEIKECSIDQAIEFVYSDFISNKFFDAIADSSLKKEIAQAKNVNPDLSNYDFSQTFRYMLDRGFTIDTIHDWHLGIDKKDPSVVIPVYFKKQLMGIIKRMLYREPKYINTPGMIKSEILFGYDKYIFTDGWVNICEGPLDCIWMHQNGYPNTVATLGASLSYKQFLLLRQIGTGVRICYDNDTAGWNAAKKIEKQYKHSIAVNISKLPGQYKDVQEIRDFHNITNFDIKQLLVV